MTFMDKVYTLRTEVRGDGKTAYFISFTDGQGEFYDLEVSEPFFVEFRQMERKNRNLQQSDAAALSAGELKRTHCIESTDSAAKSRQREIASVLQLGASSLTRAKKFS